MEDAGFIEQLGPDDWQRYRDIRLEALGSDPGAFASSYEREAGFDEATWRSRLAAGPDGRPNAVLLVTDRDGTELGTELGTALGTASVIYTEHHPAPMLVAMWVRPEGRGRGVGRRLVDAAQAWAVEQGERSMVLWVVHDNDAAIALYRSCGFEPTGTVKALPSNPCADELEMTAALD